jgi:hypothetical protein
MRVRGLELVPTEPGRPGGRGLDVEAGRLRAGRLPARPRGDLRSWRRGSATELLAERDLSPGVDLALRRAVSDGDTRTHLLLRLRGRLGEDLWLLRGRSDAVAAAAAALGGVPPPERGRRPRPALGLLVLAVPLIVGAAVVAVTLARRGDDPLPAPAPAAVPSLDSPVPASPRPAAAVRAALAAPAARRAGIRAPAARRIGAGALLDVRVHGERVRVLVLPTPADARRARRPDDRVRDNVLVRPAAGAGSAADAVAAALGPA